MHAALWLCHEISLHFTDKSNETWGSSEICLNVRAGTHPLSSNLLPEATFDGDPVQTWVLSQARPATRYLAGPLWAWVSVGHHPWAHREVVEVRGGSSPVFLLTTEAK